MTDKDWILRLIEADDKNVSTSTRYIESEIPELLPTAEEVSNAFSRLMNAFSEREDYDAAQERVQEWASSFGNRSTELFELLQSAKLIGTKVGPDAIADRKADVHSSESIIVRVLLMQRIWREFVIAIVELMRLRMIPTFGCGRAQAEAVGLISLIGKNPQKAGEWMNAFTESQGLAFYRENQKDVKSELSLLGLEELYEKGSNAHFHVRAFGLTPALLSGLQDAGDGEIGLSFQEFQNLPSMAAWMAYFLETELKVVEALKRATPELSDYRSVQDDYLSVKIDSLRKAAAKLRGRKVQSKSKRQ